MNCSTQNTQSNFSTINKNADTSNIRPGSSRSSNTKPESGNFEPRNFERTVPPSLKAYRTRRAAHRVLSKFANVPDYQLSDEDRASIVWAETHKNYHPGSCIEQQPSTIVHQQQRFFSEIPQETQIIAIVDTSNPDGLITQRNWQKVDAALSRVYSDVLKANPGPAPRCKDAGWYQGLVKLMECADQRSVDLFSAAIAFVGEVWPGANLQVVTRNNFINQSIANTAAPTVHSRTNTVNCNVQNNPASRKQSKDKNEAADDLDDGKDKPEWWTAEIGELRRASRRLFNIAKAHNNWDKYKEKQREFKSAVRRAKRAAAKEANIKVESTSEVTEINSSSAEQIN